MGLTNIHLKYVKKYLFNKNLLTLVLITCNLELLNV
jgi:hypothetical protein